jgi:hypothetical protein
MTTFEHRTLEMLEKIYSLLQKLTLEPPSKIAPEAPRIALETPPKTPETAS